MVRVTDALHQQIEGGLAELAVQVFPVVGADSHLSLVLLLAVSPLAKAFQVDKLHGACALAWTYEGVALVFFFI